MINKVNKKIFDDLHSSYTNFHCMIISLMNRYNFQQYSNKDITETQFNIIDFVIRNGKKSTSDIAKTFNISTPAVSRQIKLLLENELISQIRDETDRRIFYIEATERGKKMVEDSTSIRQYISKQINEVLNEEEVISFTNNLNKIVKNIKLG